MLHGGKRAVDGITPLEVMLTAMREGMGELHHEERGCSVRLLGWIEHRKRGARRAGDRRD